MKIKWNDEEIEKVIVSGNGLSPFSWRPPLDKFTRKILNIVFKELILHALKHDCNRAVLSFETFLKRVESKSNKEVLPTDIIMALKLLDRRGIIDIYDSLQLGSTNVLADIPNIEKYAEIEEENQMSTTRQETITIEFMEEARKEWLDVFAKKLFAEDDVINTWEVLCDSEDPAEILRFCMEIGVRAKAEQDQWEKDYVLVMLQQTINHLRIFVRNRQDAEKWAIEFLDRIGKGPLE